MYDQFVCIVLLRQQVIGREFYLVLYNVLSGAFAIEVFHSSWIGGIGSKIKCLILRVLSQSLAVIQKLDDLNWFNHDECDAQYRDIVAHLESDLKVNCEEI